MQETLPNSISSFEKKHPAVWKAFAKLGEVCHETGPLDEKTRRLVKLAMAVASDMKELCTQPPGTR